MCKTPKTGSVYFFLKGYHGQLSKALQLEKAYVVNSLRNIDVPFAFILQVIVFDAIPDGKFQSGAYICPTHVDHAQVFRYLEASPYCSHPYCWSTISPRECLRRKEMKFAKN